MTVATDLHALGAILYDLLARGDVSAGRREMSQADAVFSAIGPAGGSFARNRNALQLRLNSALAKDLVRPTS